MIESLSKSKYDRPCSLTIKFFFFKFKKNLKKNLSLPLDESLFKQTCLIPCMGIFSHSVCQLVSLSVSHVVRIYFQRWSNSRSCSCCFVPCVNLAFLQLKNVTKIGLFPRNCLRSFGFGKACIHQNAKQSDFSWVTILIVPLVYARQLNKKQGHKLIFIDNSKNKIKYWRSHQWTNQQLFLV